MTGEEVDIDLDKMEYVYYFHFFPFCDHAFLNGLNERGFYG